MTSLMRSRVPPIIKAARGFVSSPQETFVGYLPTDDALNLTGLHEKVNVSELMKVDKDFWINECRAIKAFFDDQVGRSLPSEIAEQLKMLEERIKKSP